jgi:hypothetical protein
MPIDLIEYDLGILNSVRRFECVGPKLVMPDVPKYICQTEVGGSIHPWPYIQALLWKGHPLGAKTTNT